MARPPARNVLKAQKVAMKVCSRCSTPKPRSEFPKAKSCADGTRSYCKVCDKARKDIWRRDNREKHNEKCRAWVENNREKRKAISRAYREKVKADGREREFKRAWREANLDRARAYTNHRRRKLRAATPPWVDSREVLAVYEEAKRRGMTVDHIIPIQHPLVCGLHVPWNLQLLTLAENSAKQNEFAGVVGRCRTAHKFYMRKESK